MPDLSQYFPITAPTLIFSVVLCIILFAPIIMGKLRIPHIVGMVLAGMAIGPYGLNILVKDNSFELFGQVGLYYIMFLAGLEINMKGLKSNGLRIIAFGVLTFFVPFALVYAACTALLGYTPLASLLLGSILGSNTLIAYPIVCKYGLQKHPCVTMCVGASMVSLTFALVVLAAIVGTHSSGGGAGFWALFVCKFVAFFAVCIPVVPRVARWFLRRYSDSVMQYIFVMAMMFFCAALSDALGIEGVFGAFFAGLVLNRYIPHVSPLMNRIEFIGNALFIPYFLIGVGMIIDMRVLFMGWHTAYIIFCFVFFGTLGKAIAAYATSCALKLPRVQGHMMFGLTEAHAAGSIAIVMVGIRLAVGDGKFLLDNDMLNGVVMMILFTCVIGTIMTEYASREIVLGGMSLSGDENDKGDDENILIPFKYPDTANTLLGIALMTRNQKLNRGLIGLNVVYDDINRRKHQEQGKELLEKLSKMASAADVRMMAQVRIATNIANGIKHAFNEYDASEIIMGMHDKAEKQRKPWGEFAQSLYNGLNRQIMMVRCTQPLNTLRRIQVAVPSRSEYEPGFCRWLERLSRLAENLDCKIQFHGKENTNALIKEYIMKRHPDARAEFSVMEHWNELPRLASSIPGDHLFVVVTARKGTVSYKAALERLPEELERFFSGNSLMVVFPDQYGESAEAMTFADPQHHEQMSAYKAISMWLQKKIRQ